MVPIHGSVMTKGILRSAYTKNGRFGNRREVVSCRWRSGSPASFDGVELQSPALGFTPGPRTGGRRVAGGRVEYGGSAAGRMLAVAP